MAIFFRSRSFAAERDEPELILAIYAVSVSSDLRSALKRPFLACLSPRRGYTDQVPSSRPAAQRNLSFANHRVQGEKNAGNGTIRVLSLHNFCFAFACPPCFVC
jgi:hypothetical protein